jgi:hypothetical protein
MLKSTLLAATLIGSSLSEHRLLTLQNDKYFQFQASSNNRFTSN